MISVIITNHNYEKYVNIAIESAVNQREVDYEVIVVDDGSTDRSVNVIRECVRRHKCVRVIEKKRGGQASAFNIGVSEASGEIIAFLDADDYWFPWKLARVYRTHKFAELVQHNLLINNEFSYASLRGGWGQRRRLLRHGYAAIMPTSAVSITRRLADRLFPIPEEGLEICADAYVKYAALLHTDMWTIEEPLGVYSVHGENLWYGRTRSALFKDIVDKVNSYSLAVGRDCIPYKDSSFMDFFLDSYDIDTKCNYIIYGAGGAGRAVLSSLRQRGVGILGFVDSDERKWGEVVDGVMVRSTNSSLGYISSGDRIIVASIFASQIENSLLASGVKQDVIVMPKF